jgi:hypothetical protein
MVPGSKPCFGIKPAADAGPEGGMLRCWLKGRENVHKRYLIHVAGHNLGLLMSLLIGAETPKEAAARGRGFRVIVRTENTLSIVIYDLDQIGLGIPSSTSLPSQHDHNGHIINGC